MRIKSVVLALITFSLIPIFSMAGSWEVPPSRYCVAGAPRCNLTTPTPDTNTRDNLDNFVNDMRNNNPNGGPKPGDTITICNGYGCSTYTYTENGGYNNGKWELQEDHDNPNHDHGSSGSGSGGGGGGGGGGRGGANPPGGCYGSGCGTVTVGEIENP